MLPLTTWQAVASALAGSCSMVAYNRAGVGRTELPDRPQAPAPEYAQREIGHIHTMGESLLAGARLKGKPIVRLVAQSIAPKPDGLIKDLMKGVILAEDFEVWALDPDKAEARMDALYPQSGVKPVQAQHRIPELAPGAGIEAIRQVMEKVQGPN